MFVKSLASLGLLGLQLDDAVGEVPEQRRGALAYGGSTRRHDLWEVEELLHGLAFGDALGQKATSTCVPLSAKKLLDAPRDARVDGAAQDDELTGAEQVTTGLQRLGDGMGVRLRCSSTGVPITTTTSPPGP